MGTLVRLKKFADLLKKNLYFRGLCWSLGSAYKTIGDIGILELLVFMRQKL